MTAGAAETGRELWKKSKNSERTSKREIAYAAVTAGLYKALAYMSSLPGLALKKNRWFTANINR